MPMETRSGRSRERGESSEAGRGHSKSPPRLRQGRTPTRPGKASAGADTNSPQQSLLEEYDAIADMVELILTQRERRGQRQPPRQALTEREAPEALNPQESDGAINAPPSRAADSTQPTGLSAALEAGNQTGDEDAELPSARQAALRAVRQLQERRARAAQSGQGAHAGRADAAQPTGAAAGQRPGRVDFGAAEAARRANAAPPGGARRDFAVPGLALEMPKAAASKLPTYTGVDYKLWLAKFRTHAKVQGYWEYLMGRVPSPPPVTSRTQGTPEDIMQMLERLQLHDHALERAFDALLSAMEKPEHQRLIIAFAGSDEEPPRPDLAWLRLQAAHAVVQDTDYLRVSKEMADLRMEKGE